MKLHYDLVSNGIYDVYVISDDEYIGPEAVFVYKTFT